MPGRLETELVHNADGSMSFYYNGVQKVTFDAANNRVSFAAGVGLSLPTGQSKGIVDLPLTSWRIADAAATNYGLLAATAAIGSGGVGGIDASPGISRVNAATDKAARIVYADAVVKPILNDFTLPYDFDPAVAANFKILCAMAGTSNATSILTLTWWTVGPGVYAADTEQGGACSAIADASLVTKSIAIAAKAINAPGNHVAVSLTPTSPGTDAMHIYGTYLEYTKKLA